MNSVLLRTAARYTMPALAIFSLYLLIRGHNFPGGGFIAGLLMAAAIVLQFLAFGPRYIQERLSLSDWNMMAAGLLLATATGVAGLVLGFPFLTQTFTYVTVPIFGEIELATAVIFDVGVYLVVIGATLLIIRSIGVDERVAGEGDS